jgi:hypothetical protein
LSKGTYVGDVIVHYHDGSVWVEFDLLGDEANPQYVMAEAHVWIGCEPYPRLNNDKYTVAPGQYNFNSNGDLSDTNTKNMYSTPPIDASGSFYFIAHAVVCDVNVPDGAYLPGAPYEGGTMTGPNAPYDAADCNVDTSGWGKVADFKAYPVPFDNEVNVSYKFDYDTTVKIETFDIKGTLVRSTEDTQYVKGTVGRTTIDLSKADNHMYFVRLTTSRGTMVKKVVSSGLNKQ